MLAAVALAGWALPSLAATAPGEAGQSRFAIPAQRLESALAAFGAQSGLQVSIDAAVPADARSGKVSGLLSAPQALARLLAGTGYAGRIKGGIVTVAPERPAAAGTISTGPLHIEGGEPGAATAGAARDARGHDDIYDRDTTTTYMGKDEVERYKGVTSSDVLKGMLGVYSGDARNGGAIDPSVRGISGPGRVPVIVDGTEQALTVWRGYNGASNRAYIDPNLISGIQVQKGPVSERGVDGAIGGAVIIRTLDADDILRTGQAFGIEAKLEGGNNSTAPRWPTLLTGKDYHEVPGFPGSDGTPGSFVYPANDPAVLVKARTREDNDLLSLGDRAARIAMAGRLGRLDLFGAYAYRTHGNYFAGENGFGYYAQADANPDSPGTFIQRMAFNYLPGNEVTNTSSRTSSWLAKLAWHINGVSDLKAGFRDTRASYGDIMPSRIVGWGGTIGSIQWPASHVRAQAYNLDYRLQPGLWWLDLKAGLWDTHTLSETNSNGGYPNAATYTDPILRNTAVASARNDRFGFIASNQFKLGSRLDLLVQGNWQREVLRPRSASAIEAATTCASFFCGNYRSGRREEYRIDLKSEWRPFRFLKLNAGATYAGFRSDDDRLRNAVKDGSLPSVQSTIGYVSYIYFNTQNQADYRRRVYARILNGGADADATPDLLAAVAAEADRIAQGYEASDNGWSLFPVYLDPVFADANGRYSRADIPCLNGSYNDRSKYDLARGCTLSPITIFRQLNLADTQLSSRNWAPTASATLYITESSRAYVRYAEASRYPSLFESTIGFSQSLNPSVRLRPEHAHAFEAAFIQDLRPLLHLQDQHKADLKLVFYRNVTTDVIERDTHLKASNIAKQILSGLEVQARYDNGWLFGDFGYAHVLTNKACDATRAITTDIIKFRVPDCVKYGFYRGYLLTQAAPDNSLNVTLGARMLQRRLEFGPRFVWYSRYKNALLERLLDPADPINGYALNVPYAWGANLTVDAYVRFRISPRFTAEINGTNLTDRYYGDPLTRSLNPAPGRTLRFSLTGRL
ncbi:TonB-dependent receptor [Sphingomonas morindae]|uniref:TonB-dependent receptor n=1 Tax=Sphingomonas morindae TaxID=1541170 RepID=A0ABY4X9P7_9SPHN|nr:TonB-dependent receptor [Sphingomonas morindae]USI73660.1 TonB-dependent receptor [Sphingomonas morindae]